MPPYRLLYQGCRVIVQRDRRTHVGITPSISRSGADSQPPVGTPARGSLAPPVDLVAKQRVDEPLVLLSHPESVAHPDRRIPEGHPPPSAIRDAAPRYTERMTKRLVDVDDDKLEQVRTLLGTSTTKATVNEALAEVLALGARREALLNPELVTGSADLADDAHRRSAWA